ncbi:flavodoxin family protein [Clostridium grantii]|uniref:Multimeric flavodoxin WrbA n=1 Tax=Clostridium grantii DSM 8605 TaxID=1121316 RepID=A0A1M5S7S4_9CLOT|nr:flavodoxin family protein [Clostridium grantii]SHH34657.1 Multimeric flavodoxin WrbA [Clostridium grantii DSM 8605]
MKVIGITGSPREKSNTKYFVENALNEISTYGLETELISLDNKYVKPCKGCYSCVKNKECIQKDDDFEEIFEKIKSAEGIIVGSPVYHGATTPNLKALLDRAGFLGRWVSSDMKAKNESYDFKGTVFSGKVGAPITVARRTGQTFAFAELLLWFTVNDFIVVGSSYWNVGIAGKGGAVDAENDDEGVLNIKHFASNMANAIKKLNA